MMRIAVVNLTGGGFSGGYRKYLSRLMPLLASDPRVEALTVFVPTGTVVGIDPGIDVRPLRGLRGDIAVLKPDVVFVPTARYVDVGSIPVVTMVRNMEPLTVPFGGNTWTEGLKNVVRAYEARRACRRAARVIAVSEHVREYVMSGWRIPPARVATVYHGVDAAATIERPVRGAARTLFTAGSIRPARGLEDVIRALALVGDDVQLMIAGAVDAGCEGYAEMLGRLCTELEVGSRVTFAGQLDETQMIEQFRGCSAFVLTSRAEACPNTALEAMSAGCPIVSVDRAPMPEFLADAALYYPIGDATVLAAALRELLADPVEQNRLSRAARSRVARFTWTSTRDRTIEELERVRA